MLSESRKLRYVQGLGAGFSALLLSITANATSTGVITEGVDDYGCGGCNANNCSPSNDNDLCNSASNNTGFLNALTSTGKFSSLVNFTNGSVYDTDFVDPDTGHTGNDTQNFDVVGGSFSYFTGHGLDGSCTTQACTHSSQCTTPGKGGGFTPPAGHCQSSPGNGPSNTGQCCYDSNRYLITHSSNDQYGGNVGYSTNWVKFGESAYSTNWAGAGTNGGTNVVIIDASWPVMANFGWNQLGPFFAGMRIVAATQPVWGDQANVADRGAAFAHPATQNINSSVYSAWPAAMSLLAYNEGSPCGASDYSQGGGHGFNGCGCNLVIAADASQTLVSTDTTASWLALQNDLSDAFSKNYYTWNATCNYDSSTFQWSLP